MHVVNLSREENDELIRCFLFRFNDKEKTKKIAISYIDRFIGNKMNSDLFREFMNMKFTYSMFYFQIIWIKYKPYIMFYIEDYFRLVAADDSIEYNIKCISRGNMYKDVVELNGYQILYSCYKSSYYIINTRYINFIVCKDNIVYIVNKYCNGEELKISIKDTVFVRQLAAGNKVITDDYEFETPGLSKQQLKEYLDAILIINELKDGD